MVRLEESISNKTGTKYMNKYFNGQLWYNMSLKSRIHFLNPAIYRQSQYYCGFTNIESLTGIFT